MLQLAYVSEREGGGPKALEASAAAHRLLIALGTDPSHGLLPLDPPLEDQEQSIQEAQHRVKSSGVQLLGLRGVMGVGCLGYWLLAWLVTLEAAAESQ